MSSDRKLIEELFAVARRAYPERERRVVELESVEDVPLDRVTCVCPPRICPWATFYADGCEYRVRMTTELYRETVRGRGYEELT